MKKHYFIDSFIFVTLIFTTVCFFVITRDQSTIDIQLHDTYIIVDKLQAIILIMGPVTFFTFLVLALIRRFRTITTNIGFIAGLFLLTLLIYQGLEIEKGFRDEINKAGGEMTQDSGMKDAIDSINDYIYLTQGAFVLLIIGIGLTGFRTYKLLRRRQSA